jgi:hypothetical protein
MHTSKSNFRTLKMHISKWTVLLSWWQRKRNYLREFSKWPKEWSWAQSLKLNGFCKEHNTYLRNASDRHAVLVLRRMELTQEKEEERRKSENSYSCRIENRITACPRRLLSCANVSWIVTVSAPRLDPLVFHSKMPTLRGNHTAKMQNPLHPLTAFEISSNNKYVDESLGILTTQEFCVYVENNSNI